MLTDLYATDSVEAASFVKALGVGRKSKDPDITGELIEERGENPASRTIRVSP